MVRWWDKKHNGGRLWIENCNLKIFYTTIRREGNMTMVYNEGVLAAMLDTEYDKVR